jgi:hypothetical protein
MGKALHAKLRAVYEAWGESRNDKLLVEQVGELAERFGKEKPEAAQVKWLTRGYLELICFEYVSS